MADETKIERVVKKLVASDLRVITRNDVDGDDGRRQWFALRTRPGKEGLAEILMLQAGHLAFCPMEMVERRANRWNKAKKAKSPRPMLTSMILAGFDGDVPWFPVFRLGVITGVIGVGDRAIQVPHKAVRRVLQLSGRAAALRRPIYRPKVGDAATVADGPFGGLTGRIEECTDRRARVLLDLDDGAAAFPVDLPVELLAEAS